MCLHLNFEGKDDIGVCFCKFMVTYKIQEVELQTQPDEFLHKVCDFWDISFRWYEKDDPLPDRDQRIHSIRNPHPHHTSFNWIVQDENDNIIGTAGIGFENEQSPSYEDNKLSFGGSIGILPKFRRKGIAKDILSKILKKGKEHDKTILQTGAALPEGFAFVENYLNGKVAQKGAENRLYFDAVDWDMVKEWRDEGKSRNPDTELIYFEDCPEEIIEDYVEFYTEVVNQMPKGEMEWTHKQTPEYRRLTEQRKRDQSIEWYTLITKESNGDISGMTEMNYNTKQPYKIGQDLTGVRHDYRGKGLGKWLKAEMLLRVHKKYPDLKYVATGNASENAPMLSINHRMGFKLKREWRAYKFQMKELEQFIID